MAEATAGHVLHLVRIPGLAGFIMFPVGFFLMSRAFNRTGGILAVLLTSWVAAGIKLADLFLPGADFMAVWNPAQAILLEGLAATALIVVLKRARATAAWATLASLSWRMAYVALGLLWVELLGARNLIQAEPAFLLRFFLLDSLVNGSLIYFLIRMSPFKTPVFVSKAETLKIFFRPAETKTMALGQKALAAALLIAAVSFELVL